MAKPVSDTCVDSQTVAQCDTLCGSGVSRDCRVWGRPYRPLTVEIPQAEYRALKEIEAACRVLRQTHWSQWPQARAGRTRLAAGLARLDRHREALASRLAR